GSVHCCHTNRGPTTTERKQDCESKCTMNGSARGRGHRGRGRGRGGGRVGRGRGRGLYVANDTQLVQAPQTSGRGQQRRRKIYQDHMPQKDVEKGLRDGTLLK
ncbi:unnamed protein product, partial [Ectocarpus sp. 6 AP-2014]